MSSSGEENDNDNDNDDNGDNDDGSERGEDEEEISGVEDVDQGMLLERAETLFPIHDHVLVNNLPSYFAYDIRCEMPEPTPEYVAERVHRVVEEYVTTFPSKLNIRFGWYLRKYDPKTNDYIIRYFHSNVLTNAGIPPLILRSDRGNYERLKTVLGKSDFLNKIKFFNTDQPDSGWQFLGVSTITVIVNGRL